MELQAAKSWGLTPLAYAERPREERLVIVAEYHAAQLIEAYQSDKHNKEMDRQQRAINVRR